MREQVLHSRYNPEGEAERYLNSITVNSGVRFFVLVEPGAGYLSAAVKKNYPQAKVLALHAEKIPESLPEERRAHAAWSPEKSENLRDFLEREIPDVEALAIKLIEWRPALAVYGQAYRFLLAETVEFIKQADASARTQAKFGKRWFRNFFRNLNIVKKIIQPEPFSLPIVIAGAGPGLEDTIPLVRRERGNIMMIAVSSAAAALNANRITPDLVVATDGGGWALLHLYECFRGNEKTKLAVNLTAALPSQCEQAAILVMCDGSLWQTLALKGLGVPFVTLPQRGTVSASALDLAFALTSGKVFLTGVDLSHRDIRSHVRPYSFDRLWNEKAARTNPVYSQVFARSGLIQAGGSHSVYANWFGRQLAAYPKRLFSLGTNNQVFNALKTTSLEIGETAGTKPALKTIRFNPAESPRETALRVLKTALTDPLYGATLRAELASLLCSGASPSVQELEKTIDSLTKQYG